ncbi:YrhB domain-containing protein [Kitasatospora sp. NPDC056138]|uniref:YrhB domain-containing protein n=1 Tax=Kitasatospora sp. NPDC056138 TaxID=3345724 RepID=UPI0035DDFF03
MLSKDEAHASAAEFLKRTYGDGPPTIVLQPELTVEHDYAWAVRFDSQEHLKTGDIMLAPFNRLLVVPKDGSRVRFAPTALSVEESRVFFATGQLPQRGTKG